MGGGGVTPTDRDVYLTADTPPHVLAHELGHIISWKELGTSTALMAINPAGYVRCDGIAVPAWSNFSTECEQAAHWEGFANFVEAAWAWERTAPDPFIPPNGFERNPASMENAGQCTNQNNGHTHAQCHARMFWDIYDLVDDGADTMNGPTMATIALHIRRYPRGCIYPFDNHCANEGLFLSNFDLNGINHRDWLSNWRFGGLATLVGIFMQNGLGGGDAN